MNFRVGQKVVCVDATPRHWPGCPLRKGDIYTIAAMVPVGGKFGVFVSEVQSQSPNGFYPDRFRPIVERKTDISVFTKILKETRTPALASAMQGTATE